MRTSTFIIVLVGCLTWAPLGWAAEKRIEGTVKAVDADKFSLTLTAGGKDEVQTFDVLKKAKVIVNGQPETLKSVRAGQKAVVVYNPDLEVATSIEASGEGIAEPEIVVLKELPHADAIQSAPWVSENGLVLYWKTPGNEKQPWIWSAQRKTKDDLFENAKKLVPGHDPTLTGDGKELILLEKTLFRTTRPSLEAPFQRPQKMAELDRHGFLGAPCVSPDGLTLYLDNIDLETRQSTLVRFARASRSAKWGEPETVRFSGLPGKKLRFLYVTPDETQAFCSVQAVPFNWEEPLIVRWKHDRKKGEFSSPALVTVGGQTVAGKFARYVAATKELYFARQRPGLKLDELAVIRNFDPSTHVAEPGGLAKEALNDEEVLKRLQGTWLATEEESNGTVYSNDEVKQRNRKIVIKGKSFTMSRSMRGKPGTYLGSFEVNAESNSFDWSGKGPNGVADNLRGIYALDGDTLKLSYMYVKDESTPRPQSFKTNAMSGTNFVSLTLRRAK